MNFGIDVIVKSSIVLISAAFVTQVLRRRASASARHAVWILAMTSTIVLPLLSVVVPQWEWPVLPEATTTVTLLPLDNETTSLASAAEQGLRPGTPSLPETWQLRPAVIWVFGVTWLLLRFTMGSVAVRRKARKAIRIDDDSWTRLVDELSAAFRIRKPVRLMSAGVHTSPMTWGVFRHTVLLPSTAMEWTKERRRLVLAHELAHVRRKDGLLQIFTRIVCSIYWFNPMVWYASHRVRIERERACDDHVLKLGTMAEDYADHLIQIVRGLRDRRSFSFAAVTMAQPSQLETRLISILDSRVRRRTLSRIHAVALGALTCAATLGLAAVGVTAAVPLPPVLVAALESPEPAPAPEPSPKPQPAPQRTRIGNGASASAVIPPKVVSSKPPIYTEEAIFHRIEGIVTLEASVDAGGNMRILRVVKELGYGLDQRAIGAVLDWKFSPATRNGVPVQAITQIDVEFKLPPVVDPTSTISLRLRLNGVDPVRLDRTITPPTIVSRVEPEYSAEAKAARYQGTVVLRLVVKKDGSPDLVDVVRSLGLGLDEKAIEALKEWRFKPGMRNGEPVDVMLNVEVNFNLK